ncbi:2,3-bisphosphoglycerate-independent phosphoglycerate mutase [Oceanibacterium hippocampi]|uniref:2,3-bisphosphoglycerate-independent phosphoglycerate mutase n=1 Tax=Oceanibacterium hippocampi TaxID=745714 RepID=A0A1Y5RBB5_9PROT|nr:2,3-bisphosphoglycerate-independent phosphoglycerate mutase [Oceanibacterium hippocampi]SLN13350.1 2,3-bisphosphoglycerate-independent phosphoglycerate mutase [Oceanibacterium hippocampi]
MSDKIHSPATPHSRRPVVLCILDGWGAREDSPDNAIAMAATPNWDRLIGNAPHSLLDTSGEAVGLPAGQMGNSEVGHMNIGGGRVVMQDLPRIDKAVADGSLAGMPALRQLIATLRESGGACHMMGLVSPGGVHAHQDHMLALAGCLDAAGIPVRIHAFLDGRDTPPRSAMEYLQRFETGLAALKDSRIATVAGRYYAMDRDKRWERVSRAYETMVDAAGERQDSAGAMIEASYRADVGDEFVEPAPIGDYAGMRDGDGLLMANFRADRAREILTALLDPAFDGFRPSRRVAFAATLGLVAYSDALDPFIAPLFPSVAVENALGEVVSRAGRRQLRIAETEKYAHVTFFLNGGEERVFDGEDRILVPSPKVATYDLQPEMSAPEVTDRLVEAIDSGRYDLIVVNYANPDMVGHTGKLDAAVRAVECIDGILGRLHDAVARAGGALLVTADHGNIEQMSAAEGGAPHTAHTTNRVPFVLADAAGESWTLEDGRLADIAPTILALMGLKAPAEMTGHSLASPAARPARAAELRRNAGA